MGFDGSVRLGWKARCTGCGSDMMLDAFSSSLLRRHAAFGFRFLSEERKILMVTKTVNVKMEILNSGFTV